MKARVTLACVVALALLSACGNLFDTAAAVVGGRKITVAEVTDALDRFTETEEYQRLSAQGDVEAIQRRFEQAYLSELIRRAVLDPKAEELGIEVTDEEVDETIQGIEDEFGSQSAFEEALKEQGLDQEQLVQIVHDNILEDKVKEEVTGEIEADESEIRAFYDENIADYTRTRSSHILVDELALAQELSDRLQETPKKKLEKLFAQLAREHSNDKQSAKKGGDLDFTTAGQLAEPFENAAAKLDVGEVSEPVRTQFGYHVILVTDRETTPFDGVRDSIAGQLGEGAAEEAWQEWLTQAYEDADIRINSRFGELDVDSKQVVDATSEDIPGAVETPTPSPSQ